jgi:hypothetical protein
MKPITNRTSAKSNAPQWINDLTSLGNLMSMKDSIDIGHEDSANPKDLKEIAKNADSLIQILQNLKKHLHEPDVNEIAQGYYPPSGVHEQVIQLESDVDDIESTNLADDPPAQNVKVEESKENQEGFWDN